MVGKGNRPVVEWGEGRERGWEGTTEIEGVGGWVGV